jgi:hypothetical protein
MSPRASHFYYRTDTVVIQMRLSIGQQRGPLEPLDGHLDPPLKDPLEQPVAGLYRLRTQLMKHCADSRAPISRRVGASTRRDQLSPSTLTLAAQLRIIVMGIAQHIQRLLGIFRTRGMRVVYTTVASELPDGADLMPILRQRNAMAHAAVQEPYIPHKDDAWARLVPSLTPQPNELVINKTTYGTFTSTGLDRALRNMGIHTLVIG